MSGVLEGVEVLDLSWGIAGPMAGMLLADNGARVTRVEPPGGSDFDGFSGNRVWHRGKRSALLDLKASEDRDRFLELARRSDVLIESFSPGTTRQLGIDFETLHALNPRLVYCSITGYGSDGRHADRPGYDALVAARTGQQWESRGVPGGTLTRLAGAEGALPDLEVPEDCWVGAPRQGPLFGGVPWPSMATFYLATLAISSGLRVREVTGRGQWVRTSLLQGVLATTVGGWQRVERIDSPHYQSWITDPRAPKGFFQCADGRWVHNWVPLPSFVLGVSEGDRLEITEDIRGPKAAGMRIGLDPEDMVVLHAYQQPMAEAFRRFPSTEWSEIAATVGVPVQIVRSPEEALLDPLLVADGCVTEVDDPELGVIRQVGRVYSLSACPTTIDRAAPVRGQHTEEVLAELAAPAPQRGDRAPAEPRPIGSPLEGVVVLDLGLAVAGPWGTQLLAQLGAEVIKVNTLHDGYWMSNHIGMCCNRDKRSISINLKDPNGLDILRRLVERADIVQHNMRYDAAERLGVDYESLREINPQLIYCHTRGFERGPRESLPGNDQTGAALAGTDWLDGGCDDGGKPIWPVISLGDTGNGFLSAIGMMQALYHRDRTGEGQFVDTSIIYAHLLSTSTAWVTPDGTRAAERPSLDAMQLGWHALYRLYETADGWLCLAALAEPAWQQLCAAVERDDLATDARFATPADRRANDRELTAILEEVFASRAASAWFSALDARGVPCEVSTPDFVLDLFDDPEMIDNGWVTSYQHPVVGKMDLFGHLIDFSETPGRMWGPPLTPGQDTRAILHELGFDDDQIDKLLAEKVVAEPAPTA